MASVNITGTFCNANAGAHANVVLKVNGAAQGSYPLVFDDITAPVTDEEKALFTRLMLKLHYIGKTPSALRSDVIAGFTVTI